MEKKPFALALIVAVMALVVFNTGFRKNNHRDSCEISSYEYARLYEAMDRYEEIAAVAQRELTHDYVSIAQYNTIMQQVDAVKLKQARRMAAMHRTAER